jgi:hypothetical protein
MAERLQLSAQNAQHVQAYINYYNTVGNEDGGKMFSEKEYEEYKANLQKNAKNRIYTSWRNIKGTDCKIVGPSTKCFCDHRYKEHNHLNPVDKRVHCKVKGCPCPNYYYIPVHASQDFKCLCKHSYTEHDPITKKCLKGKCGCGGKFASTWSCSCNYKFGDHQTVFETRDERIRMGKSTDEYDRLMGDVGMSSGMGNFSSLVDGAESFGYKAQLMALEGPQGGGNKAISGGPMQRAIGGGGGTMEESKGNPANKTDRLAKLNQRIGLEKRINALENGSGPMQGEEGEYEDNPDEEVTALELFNMPHQFTKAKVTLKPGLKQIRH